MPTELQSLAKIFNNRLFRIPDYQRGFAWGERQLADFGPTFSASALIATTTAANSRWKELMKLRGSSGPVTVGSWKTQTTSRISSWTVSND